jgi:tetratricopeptide (TPR) repeat protein
MMAERAPISGDTHTREVYARFAIVLAACITFARALPYALQRSWDDGRFIIDNPDVQHVSWASLVSIFTRVRFEAYHPLHLLSYWLDVPWFGPDPFALHCVSLALWAVALVLVYECMRALGISQLTATLATLALGLHPVQVEVVSWATGRKDVLALLFSSACLLGHLRSRHPNDASAWWSRAFFAAAALSKTTALPLPLLLVAIDRFGRGVPLRAAVSRQLPSAALAFGLGLVVMRVWEQNEMMRATNADEALAPLRMLNTLQHQLSTAVWPARVAPMYSTQTVAEWTVRTVAVPAAFVAALVVAYRRTPSLVFAALLGFLALYLPTSNLVPLYFPYQDRYASLPLLPLAIAMASAVDHAARSLGHRGWPQALLAACVLCLGLRTVQYQGEWASETRLWGHAARTQPDADYAWLKLGETRRDANDLEGAISAYRALLDLSPSRKLAHAALFEAVALRDERIAHTTPSRARVLAQSYYRGVDDADAMQNLSGVLLASGYMRAIELSLSRSLALAPQPDAVLERAAAIQLAAGRTSLSRTYVAAMQSPPKDPRLRELMREAYFPVRP